MNRFSGFFIVTIFLVLIMMSCAVRQVPVVKSSRTGGWCLPDAVERVKYFQGKLLSANDFQAEQSYFRSKNQLHNQLLHGTGVVCGLIVSVVSENPRQVSVSPGIAIDGTGQEIIIPSPVVISLDDYNDDIYLTLRYHETLADPVPIPGNSQQNDYSKINEDYEIEVLQDLPQNYLSTYDLLNEKERGSLIEFLNANHSTCCNDSENRPVVLAKIDLPNWGRFNQHNIDNVRYRNFVFNFSDILFFLSR